MIHELLLFPVQWTVGGTKGKKKVKQGKGSEKKNATKKKVNKATASGSSDGDSSAESSAPEEGTCPAAGEQVALKNQPSFRWGAVLMEGNSYRDA